MPPPWDPPGTVLTGVLVAVGVQAARPAAAPGPAGRGRPLAFLHFLAYFCYKLVEANLVVAWEVVTPRSRINQGIVAVPIRGASDVVITSVANAISLTPGTLTLEVRRSPATLYVHVLHLHSVEATRREVLYLELLLMRALAPGCTEEIAWLEGVCGKPGRRG
jgi:multicomponent Na+:H+ antiporter subunit E